MIFSVLLATSLLVQDQQPIQFRADGERLDSIVARIAEESGQALSVSPEGSKHYLVIRVNESSWEEVLDGIAAATSSKWEEAGFGLRLNPDVEARRSRKQAEEAELVARIDDGIAKWIVDHERAKDTADTSGTFNWTSTITQELALEFISQLLPHIDAQDIVRARTDGRVVFSTNPTPMQKRFSNLPATVIPSFRRSYNEFLDWYFQDETRAQQAEMSSYQVEHTLYSKFFVWPSKGVPIDKVNLALTWYGADIGNSPLFIELQGYSTRGGHNRQIFEFSTYSAPLAVSTESTAIARHIGPDVTIEFGNELSEFFAFQPEGYAMAFSDIPEFYRQIVLNPERHDPQALFVPPMIDSLFGHLEGDVIASVPDYIPWMLVSPFQRDEMMPYLIDSLKRNCQYELVAGVHVISPKDAAAAAAGSVDREILGKFVRDYQRHITVPIRVLANFLDSVGNSWIDYSGMMTVRVVLGSSGFSNPWVVELLSYCDPFQTDQILDGAEGRLNNLAPGFRQRIHELVFRNNLQLTIRSPELSTDYPSLFVSQIMGSNHPTVRRRLEPTELLPYGVPAASEIRSKAYSMLGVAGHPDEGNPQQEVTVNSEYMFAYQQENNARMPAGSARNTYSKYRFGEMKLTDIRIQFAEDLSVRLMAEDSAITLDSPAYAESEIPESYRERIARARSAMAANEQLRFLFDPRHGAPPIRP